MAEVGHSGMYIALVSLHGLVRGQELELGRDADTGGQVKYVVELARALAGHPEVARVDLFTRLVEDPKVSPDYAKPREMIGERAAIVRIPFGPRRYLRKEVLWPHLDEFIDRVPQYFREAGRTPDLVHGHYADAGLAGARLASLLGVPLVFTGHSLGREKLRLLREHGVQRDTVESRYKIGRRIEAEERVLSTADLVIASTNQEVERQYAQYQNFRANRASVIPPGVDVCRFRKPKRKEPEPSIKQQVVRFLREPGKPWILALSRADERKNIRTLIEAFGTNEELREKANLVLVAGSRDDIREMDKGPRRVLTEILHLIDLHDLYGKVAYPKRHDAADVPDLYRLAAQTRGVFVNPALTEPFGLTLIEAAASGLPVVATFDGGPTDIVERCKNGIVIDPHDAKGMGTALLAALSSKARWRKWSQSGYRVARREYTWTAHVQKYLRAVETGAKHWRTSKAPLVKSRLPTVDRMLISDVDDTLTGDRKALQELSLQFQEHRSKTAFGVATGRVLESALAVLKEWRAPRPDFLITAVGSEIYYGSSLQADEGWQQHLNYRWNAKAVRDLLQGLPGLVLQKEEQQRPCKVSYFIDPAEAPPLRQLQRRLRAHRVLANLVFSRGQYLDLLPVRASKGLAVRYIAYKWGVPMERVLVAGDSGNDADCLTGMSLGVVVGNHSEELDRFRGRHRVYFADGCYARGILEGVKHYDFFGEIQQPE
jgi:sucrose-phosphate synthase